MKHDTYPLGLFSAVGIEVEWMIVDRTTLDVLPIADRVLRDPDGRIVAEVERGDAAWSNELVLHLVELKTNGPRRTWEGLGESLHREVVALDAPLAEHGARLLPTAMHPWMDPRRETRRWPHEYAEVYDRFHAIFDTCAHGWANVQSVHVNLPFADDAEFGRLHAAIRFLLPLLPALAASSPLREGAPTGCLDSRIEAYRRHTAAVPELTGDVIPEIMMTRRDYEGLLQRLYAAIAPHDPDGILQHEWLNARGAIARFDRGAIEIRLLDTQENVFADIAIARLVTAVIERITEAQDAPISTIAAWPTAELAALLAATAADAEATIIDAPNYLAALGMPSRSRIRAGDVWQHLWASTRSRVGTDPHLTAPIEHILTHGTLARRILAAVGATPTRDHIRTTYARLADCLVEGRMFDAR